jgi:hypothetical protein
MRALLSTAAEALVDRHRLFCTATAASLAMTCDAVLPYCKGTDAVQCTRRAHCRELLSTHGRLEKALPRNVATRRASFAATAAVATAAAVAAVLAATQSVICY